MADAMTPSLPPVIPIQTPTVSQPTETSDIQALTVTNQALSTSEVSKTSPAAPSPTVESIIEKTPTPEALQELNLYYFTYTGGYSGIKIKGDSYETIVRYSYSLTGEGSPDLGSARYLEFSHYSDQVAYWAERTPLELWVSDLDGKDPRLVISDREGIYQVASAPFFDEKVNLSWSPDDRYLFVEVSYRTDANLVYDLKTGTLQSFPYRCDRVALSPKTSRLATWCLSRDLPERYAVVEWGEDLWYSASPPADTLVAKNSEGNITWHWSANGDRIAYFDQNDPDGYLHISDAYAKTNQKILPGTAYWLAESLDLPPIRSPELQWSYGGDKILIYGKGDDLHPCPSFVFGEMDQGIKHHLPCWMVIDLTTGEVIWTLSQLSVSPRYSGVFIEKYFFLHAAISPDGKYLALSADSWGIYYVELVEISSGDILFSLDYRIDGVRWRNP